MKKKNLAYFIHNHTSALPIIMGIVNLTDDSFFDGGKYNNLDKALFQVEKLINEGADIIDLGAESSRPGAKEITLCDELNLLIPVLESIQSRFDCFVSIDTYKSEVMKKTAEVGIDMINDIFALTKPNAMEVAKKLNIPVCLMHMQNIPKNMQLNPKYNNVIAEVYQFLELRIKEALSFGIRKEHILIDVGFGFGKNFQHNLDLLNGLENFKKLDFPLLVGISQKSMLGKMLGNENKSRLIASVICASFAHKKGAKILRVHNVAETLDALKTNQYLLN